MISKTGKKFPEQVRSSKSSNFIKIGRRLTTLRRLNVGSGSYNGYAASFICWHRQLRFWFKRKLFRCRKLPRALKDWPAYNALKQKIDDFNETCPLLELMTNKALKARHWERISVLTGHTFDFESDTFMLRNIMEAPLLQFKEDIEVSFCRKLTEVLSWQRIRENSWIWTITKR